MQYVVVNSAVKIGGQGLPGICAWVRKARRSAGVVASMATWKPSGPTRRHAESPARKARARQVALQRPGHTNLRERTVTSATRERYVRCSDIFFSRLHTIGRCAFESMLDLADKWMDEFLNLLWSRGEFNPIGWYILFGLMWRWGLDQKHRAFFSTSRVVVRGWAKASPSEARDPAPVEVLSLLAEWLVTRCGRWGVLVAVALFLSMACYLRPNESLGVNIPMITKPMRNYRDWAIANGPRYKHNFAKNLQFDCSVIVGSCKRAWAKRLWAKFVTNVDARGHLFGHLILAHWGRRDEKTT